VLSDGERTARASFKTVDEYRQRAAFNGQVFTNFKDSYRHEIAAYLISKLLGSNLVPPCVQRRVRGDTGALCLWIEDTITDWDRRERGIEPPDLARWNDQMANVELFLQLIYDIDHRNVANLLVDDDFTIFKIDSSRAFRTDHQLQRPDRLTRFSRSMLDGLQGLEHEVLKATLRKSLTRAEIEAVWARRNAILELADARIAEKGERAVLFPY
jgi:hypothetical protein